MIYAAFYPITASIRGFDPYNRVHRDVCIVQILLEFSLTWIRLIWLLAFHMPWDRLDSTLRYPLWSYIRNPLVHWRHIERLKERNYSPLLPEFILESASLCPFGALLCSSQAWLFLVSSLSRYGGLRWWRPKWGSHFLRFTDMPSEVVSCNLWFILIEISFPVVFEWICSPLDYVKWFYIIDYIC